jgi:gliding motility-associated-like protein
VKIPFIVTGTGIVAGNTFSAFLSLPDGTFPPAGGVLLGTKNGQSSDTIRGLLPLGTAPGNRYRVRVVSSDFPITGQVAPDSLNIFGLPARPSITGDSIKCQGNPVVLTSTPATAYFWIPGGQTTPSISVLANAAIRVRISDVNGCTNTSAIRNVTISPNPVADPITANGPLVRCFGDSVTLTANPAGLTYLWQNVTPAVNTRDLTVKTSGNYSVIVSNTAGCSDTSAAVTVTFNPLPAKPVVTSPNPNICEPGPLTFQTGAGFTYEWNNTGITPNPTTQNVNITTIGSFTVTVTITDANNCRNTSDPFNGTLRKAPSLPVILTQGNDVSVCEGNNIVLVPSPFTAANTYTWNPGATVGPNFTYSALGSQSFTVTVDSNGCSRVSAPLLVNINPKPAVPVASISSGTPSFCDGNAAVLSSSPAFSYLWSPGGANTQTITVTSSGSYSVVAVSDSGCQSNASNIIDITSRPNPLKPQVTASQTSFCDGQSATISVNSPIAVNTYTWSNGLTGTPITISAGGTYFVRVDSSNNCFSTSDLLNISQNPLPVPVISSSPADLQACIGDSVVLSSNFSAGNSWNTNPVSNGNSVVIKSSANGIILTVTDGNGCVNSTLPVNVKIDPLPNVQLQKDTALVLGDDLDLQAISYSSNFTGFSWQKDDLVLGTTTVPVFNITPNQTDTYVVVITDQNGCQAKDSIRIRVARDLYVPNMFSPNKDGKNDVFKVYGFGVASIEVKIWDRLGNLIYETNRVEDIVEEAESANSVPGWDGKYKGKELGQDTYIWNVKGKLKNGEDLKANGGKNSGPVIIMN